MCFWYERHCRNFNRYYRTWNRKARFNRWFDIRRKDDPSPRWPPTNVLNFLNHKITSHVWTSAQCPISERWISMEMTILSSSTSFFKKHSKPFIKANTLFGDSCHATIAGQDYYKTIPSLDKRWSLQSQAGFKTTLQLQNSCEWILALPTNADI